MKKTAFLSMVLSAFSFIACDNKTQPQIIGEKPLRLEEIDFNYDIVKFFSKEHLYDSKLENMAFTKEIKRNIYEDDNPFRIDYLQVFSISIDKLARYENIYFPVINVITSVDNKIAVIGVRKQINQKELEKLIASVSEKYGRFKESKEHFFAEYDMLTWENDNRILQLSIVYNNEENTLKLKIDPNTGKITAGEKTPHLDCFLFILNKGQENVLKTLGSCSGDFVFLGRESVEDEEDEE